MNLANQIPLTSLPVITSTSVSDLYLVGAKGNTQSGRLSWEALSKGFVQLIQSNPSDPTSAGAAGQMSFGADGLYSYYDGVWGKTPRFIGNWADITSSTRFLSVDKAITYSEQEKETAVANLGISKATNDTLGLVRGSNGVIVDEEGKLAVVSASSEQEGVVLLEGTGPAASTGYVDNAIASIPSITIPKATETTLGGILASDSVIVDSTGKATVPPADSAGLTSGTVKLATSPTRLDTPNAAVPLSVHQQSIASTKEELRAAPTASQRGMVQASASSAVTIDQTTGLIDVKKATAEQSGVFKITGAIPTTGGSDSVPTAEAVREAIGADQEGNIAPDRLPIATNTTLGAFMTSATIHISTDPTTKGQAYVPPASNTQSGVVSVQPSSVDTAPSRVPSLAYTEFLIETALADASVTIPNATSVEAGKVLVTTNGAEEGSAAYTTPTVAYMKQYVATHGGGGGGGSWDGGTVNNAATFDGGAFCPAVTGTPAATQMVNYTDILKVVDARIAEKLPAWMEYVEGTATDGITRIRVANEFIMREKDIYSPDILLQYTRNGSVLNVGENLSNLSTNATNVSGFGGAAALPDWASCVTGTSAGITDIKTATSFNMHNGAGVNIMSLLEQSNTIALGYLGTVTPVMYLGCPLYGDGTQFLPAFIANNIKGDSLGLTEVRLANGNDHGTQVGIVTEGNTPLIGYSSAASNSVDLRIGHDSLVANVSLQQYGYIITSISKIQIS